MFEAAVFAFGQQCLGGVEVLESRWKWKSDYGGLRRKELEGKWDPRTELFICVLTKREGHTYEGLKWPPDQVGLAGNQGWGCRGAGLPWLPVAEAVIWKTECRGAWPLTCRLLSDINGHSQACSLPLSFERGSSPRRSLLLTLSGVKKRNLVLIWIFWRNLALMWSNPTSSFAGLTGTSVAVAPQGQAGGTLSQRPLRVEFPSPDSVGTSSSLQGYQNLLKAKCKYLFKYWNKLSAKIDLWEKISLYPPASFFFFFF